MDKGKPVGIWIRVSTEDQARGDSPEHHEKRARFYAESREWKVREVYHLEAVSGKSVIEHPETKKMLEHVKAGHIEGIIFSKLARLARNTRELLEFADIFEKHGAHLISLQEAIDTSTPAGRLFYTIIAAMAQWEREEIASRVAASVPIRAKLGKRLGGQSPFGYKWIDGKLIPDPKEAPVRKLMYELFLEHHRKKTVAKILNDTGFRTRKGVKFTVTTVARLLLDSTAKGLHRANYSARSSDDKKTIEKAREHWVLQEVEPIVSEEVWDRCFAILADQVKKQKRPAKRASYLFSGFAFCHCGHKMYVPSSNPKYTCTKCGNKIGIGDLEAVFQHELKTFFFSPKDVEAYLETADKTIKEKEALLASLVGEKKEVERTQDKIHQAYISDEIDMKTYGSRIRPLVARLEQIDDQVPDLEGQIDFLKIQRLSSDEVLSEAQDLYTHWPKLEHEQKRKLIENITERITIGKDEIEINLAYLPPTSKDPSNWSRTPHDRNGTGRSPEPSQVLDPLQREESPQADLSQVTSECCLVMDPLVDHR